jgi:hypothetical protein
VGQKVSIQGCRELWTQGRQVDKVILRQVIDGLLGGILMQLATLLMVVQLFAPMHGGDMPSSSDDCMGSFICPASVSACRRCKPARTPKTARCEMR